MNKEAIKSTLAALNAALDSEDDKEFRRLAASLMGAATTERKLAAVRLNAKKGGRKKGTALSEEHKAAISAARRSNKEPEPEREKRPVGRPRKPVDNAPKRPVGRPKKQEG